MFQLTKTNRTFYNLRLPTWIWKIFFFLFQLFSLRFVTMENGRCIAILDRRVNIPSLYKHTGLNM